MKYIPFILILLFASCKSKTPTEAPATESAATSNFIELNDAQYTNAGIQVAKLEARALKGKLRLNGVIEVPPQNRISVSVPMGGYIRKTDLLPGMAIKKGQVLAVLEEAGYIKLQQEYLSAKNRLSYLEKEQARQQELNTQQVNAEKALQLAQSEYQQQVITLRALREQLLLLGINPETLTNETISRNISLLSPINGHVAKVNTNIGRFAAPTDILFELVSNENLLATLTVYEKDLPYVHVGQRVQLSLPNSSGAPIGAKVILLGRGLSAQRATEAHCQLDHADNRLMQGAFLSAEVETMEANALAMPSEAVMLFEKKHFIFVTRGPRSFEMLEVQPGVADGPWIQVTSAEPGRDLSAESVVVKGMMPLLAKLKNVEEE